MKRRADWAYHLAVDWKKAVEKRDQGTFDWTTNSLVKD